MRTLREVRAERLMTMRDLATRAGLSLSSVYMVENGRTIPRLPAVRKLAAALGIDPGEVEELRRAMDVAAHGRGEGGKEAA